MHPPVRTLLAQPANPRTIVSMLVLVCRRLIQKPYMLRRQIGSRFFSISTNIPRNATLPWWIIIVPVHGPTLRFWQLVEADPYLGTNGGVDSHVSLLHGRQQCELCWQNVQILVWPLYVFVHTHIHARTFFGDILGTYQISDSKLDSAWSGLYNREACEKEEKGEKGWETPALSGCKRLKDGKPDDKRDCGSFRDTGDAVLQIPLSMPVSRKFM